jgi:hypothetical protein
MGTIKKGILGGFSGKVGTVVGASWKGISYITPAARQKSLHGGTGQPAKQICAYVEFSQTGNRFSSHRLETVRTPVITVQRRNVVHFGKCHNRNLSRLCN